MNRRLSGRALAATVELEYLSGFANEFASEAKDGALPLGQNSPQRVSHGLFAEQLSGTAFTAPRAENRRSWFYRLRPSAMQSKFQRIDDGHLVTAPSSEAQATPNRLRWSPPPLPSVPTDFISGLFTIAVTGDHSAHSGCAAHWYTANQSMKRFFYCADGEWLIVPQQGTILLHTEFGVMRVQPGEIAVVPRGVKYRVDVEDGAVRGYICENYGALLRLPELGPIGSNGLANARDFQTPVAAFEDIVGETELVAKFGGHLWSAKLPHSPLDVVAWHGNYCPYKYDLSRFNVINTVSFDHPDPSIFTVLTSPSGVPGTANVDFVIFPPRWMVAENTFRPPWFHRNIMSEMMGLIHGTYDAKADGFAPGGASLHNCMSAHGPDAATFEKASAVTLSPQRIEGTMAFMFETRFAFKATGAALDLPALQTDYDDCWQSFSRAV